MEFNVRLRILRAAHNFSQAQLGEIAGIDTKFISHVETGKMLPSPEWEQRIRAALGWTPAVDAALDALAAALAQGGPESADQADAA
ncbi:MAG: helix-turn-helix transcriptional regulator [Chloroflexi bacterium]|nr:helix-turn-helix transcriptional regulator [Chloroflexota bacterium]